MIRYVLGFAFSSDRKHVLLIEKQKPERQRGCLNGVGGKIEKGEKPFEAMARECEEETGLHLLWRCKGKMRGVDKDKGFFMCHIFYTYSDRIFNFKQKESERLLIINSNYLSEYKYVEKSKYLISFGVSTDRVDFIDLIYT